MSELRRMLRAKIHGATVTHADLQYEGSVTLSPELLQAADILPFEAVEIWNVTNGARFQTYTIQGEKGSSDLSLNGAAARLVASGDILIIASFGYFNEAEAHKLEPKVVFVDARNKIRAKRPEVPGPKLAFA